jgi:hypothetical protein
LDDLLIGVLHPLHFIHEPAWAVGIGVADGRTLRVVDQVAGVQHVQHTLVGEQAVHHRKEVPLCNMPPTRCMAGPDLELDELLVAFQLGAVVAAQAAVEVTDPLYR